MATRVQTNSGDGKYTVDDVRARIVPASSIKHYFKGLFYAQQKIGKTHFAGSSDLKTLIVDCRDDGSEAVSDRPNVDIFMAHKFSDIDQPFWLLNTQPHDYEVAVVDNLTTAAAIAMQDILGDRSRDQAAPPMIPAKPDWNKVTQQIVKLVYEWRDLPMHVLFLAYEKATTEDTEEADGTTVKVTKVGPALSPVARDIALGAVGTVGRLYVEEVESKEKPGTYVTERRMLLTPRDPFIAGTRIRTLPKVMRNPTLKRMLNLMAKSAEAPPATAQPEG